ncbi:LOW QUALITY PROTEIN: golgin subfamily B member 1 [Sabethes cyaneus]|uniref:LOW QUALITY PROTEIN: golgin subfamily B member 1 n=1 Tax=Sabethes cyaneus TaxID=53552 RepID=UPI00237ED2DF|nr:LOW QUALITY PROTEIN: golgin subfamily B member 1 [Sabethes cyaneus]
MSAPIVITVPTKYIPINLAPALAPHPVVKLESSVSSFGSDTEESASSMEEFLVRGKKRRLDHLTWEEKLQRKKLKNRVAAQTSRDRKKAKMEDMELTIQHQSDQIAQLQTKCENLQQEKEAIYGKYLDLEKRFEDLQRQFEEQKNQQQNAAFVTTTTPSIKTEPENDVTSRSVGCVSTLTGSAASASFPLQQGPETQTTVGQERTSLEVASSDKTASLWRIIALSALQDMLEEFDVSKLEELAESLLADVTSELEESDRGSCPANAEDASTGSRVSGPVVGTAPERLEPSEETDSGSSLILDTHNYSKSPFHVERKEQQSDMDQQQQQTTMVFGTFDNETNCITIILNDDELPLEEEIICEEAAEVEVSDEQQDFRMKLEPVQELLSPIPSTTCSDYSSQSAVVPLEDELAVLKCPLTPGSFVSDGGYESLGSPTGSTIDYSMSTLDEFWNLDLFPILN